MIVESHFVSSAQDYCHNLQGDRERERERGGGGGGGGRKRRKGSRRE